MDFNDFLLLIPKIKNMTLPSYASQFKMSPPFRREFIKRYKEKMKTAKQAGVMALFYPDRNRQTKFVLILRKSYKGVHSAQIGFPGGKVELIDNSLKHTALRETNEEIGIPVHDIEVVKELTEVYIPPSNYYVKPFLGFLKDTPIFVKEESEVEDTLEVLVSDFLNEDAVIFKTITTSYAKQVEVPAYKLNKQIVWGATAMMLSEIKDLLIDANNL